MAMMPPPTDEQKRRSAELQRHFDEAQARFNALSPEEQRALREAQRRSWFIGEIMLENPNISREEAGSLYERSVIQI